MNWRYTAGWLTLAAYLFVTELVVAPGQQDTMRVIGVLIFAILEGLAINRKKQGDTLTEHIRLFYQQEKARVSLVLSWALYLCVAMVNLAVDPDLMVGRTPLTVLILGLGLFGWLVPHFLRKGAGNG